MFIPTAFLILHVLLLHSEKCFQENLQARNGSQIWWNFCILVPFENIFYKKTYAKTFAENRPFFRRLTTWRQDMRVGVDWDDAEVLPRHGRPRSTATRWRMGSDTSALSQPTPQTQPRRGETTRRDIDTIRRAAQAAQRFVTQYSGLSDVHFFSSVSNLFSRIGFLIFELRRVQVL